MGEPFASPRTVGFVSGNRSLAPLSCPRCPSLRRDKTRGSGHVPAQVRVWGTLRAGGGVLRPWGEPSLSVHLALPAPLVSKVVYVKIKPLEIQTCLHLCEDPTASRRQAPRPAPPVGPALLYASQAVRKRPKRWDGGRFCRHRSEGSLALGASSAFGSANDQLTRGPVAVPMAAGRARALIGYVCRSRAPALRRQRPCHVHGNRLACPGSRHEQTRPT